MSYSWEPVPMLGRLYLLFFVFLFRLLLSCFSVLKRVSEGREDGSEFVQVNKR